MFSKLLKEEGSPSRKVISEKFRSLYVQTGQSLYEMDLIFPLKKDEWMLPFPSQQPIMIKPIVDFVKAGLPIGMGILKLEPKSERKDARVFMIGGQMWTREEVPTSISDGSVSIRVNRPMYEDHGLDPVDAFEFIPEGNQFKLAHPKLIPRMKAPKARPLVVQFDNKIFVHDQFAMDFGWEVWRQHPTFECLDLASPSSSWAAISDFFEDRTLSLYAVMGYYVVGSRIFIPSGHNDLTCFNLSTFQWETNIGNRAAHSFRSKRAYIPYDGTCVSKIEGEYHIVLHLGPGLDRSSSTAFASLVDDSGFLLGQHHLPEFNDFFFHGVMNFIFLDMQEKDEEGANKMCGVFYGVDSRPGCFAGFEVVFFTIKHCAAPAADDCKFIDCKIKGAKYYNTSAQQDLVNFHLNAFLI